MITFIRQTTPATAHLSSIFQRSTCAPLLNGTVRKLGLHHFTSNRMFSTHASFPLEKRERIVQKKEASIPINPNTKTKSFETHEPFKPQAGFLKLPLLILRKSQRTPISTLCTRTFSKENNSSNSCLFMAVILALIILGFAYEKRSNLEEKNARERLSNDDSKIKTWNQEKLLDIIGDYAEQDKLKIESGRMKTYSFREIEKKELVVRKGFLYQKGSNTVLHSYKYDEDELIIFNYIMLSNGKIIVDEQRLEKNSFFSPSLARTFHTSISRDIKPVAAGEMIFDHGRVELLNENSGHFQPKDRVHYVQEELKKMGAQFIYRS